MFRHISYHEPNEFRLDFGGFSMNYNKSWLPELREAQELLEREIGNKIKDLNEMQKALNKIKKFQANHPIYK